MRRRWERPKSGNQKTHTNMTREAAIPQKGQRLRLMGSMRTSLIDNKT